MSFCCIFIISIYLLFFNYNKYLLNQTIISLFLFFVNNYCLVCDDDVLENDEDDDNDSGVLNCCMQI